MSLVAAHAAARSADLVAAPDMPEGYSLHAYRLTRKGREAALELLRLGERREPATREALEVLLRMLDPPVAEAEALRRHYAEAVVRG